MTPGADPTAEAARPWLVPVRGVDADAPLLLCFPHAGGTAAYFHRWSAALVPEVAALPVRYPGRFDRRAEPAPRDLSSLVDAVVDAVAPLTGSRRTVLFGHSMGAVVAYEVARVLQARGTPPDALVVSGRRPPQLSPAERLPVDDEAVLADVRRLGGRGTALLEDPEIRAAFLPVIRGDYELLDRHRHLPAPALDVPVTAIVGDDDPRVTPAEAQGWAELTTGSFRLLTRPGGHFYLDDDTSFLFELFRGLRV
ncbi:thioesterase II family protein [Pseudonocardia oroxyli]|uniref:Surfactin synthase thioesterase subunit n=1 Tax=Pseudonocardia oroxyli TaxID=366584 RepID=A0A1G8C897_PSEOR|nr:alpha/beta fold hydrolase [Pseudonocardia oroxyli]SDH41624.1 Surfactin synthase thioesterase subunit [Pseudonocardia oroxyli]